MKPGPKFARRAYGTVEGGALFRRYGSWSAGRRWTRRRSSLFSLPWGPESSRSCSGADSRGRLGRKTVIIEQPAAKRTSTGRRAAYGFDQRRRTRCTEAVCWAMKAGNPWRKATRLPVLCLAPPCLVVRLVRGSAGCQTVAGNRLSPQSNQRQRYRLFCATARAFSTKRSGHSERVSVGHGDVTKPVSCGTVSMKHGRCEGGKPFGYYPGEKIALDRMQALRSEGLEFDVSRRSSTLRACPRVAVCHGAASRSTEFLQENKMASSGGQPGARG